MEPNRHAVPPAAQETAASACLCGVVYEAGMARSVLNEFALRNANRLKPRFIQHELFKANQMRIHRETKKSCYAKLQAKKVFQTRKKN